ncbi:MAG: hypothetical protein NTZ74_05400 [Chloroflexi bacterium]|nr:hypothetical protein [Chloroflexota bacterium]
MTIKIEIKTKHFNSKLFSIPWIAKVDFSKSPAGEYLWGKRVGEAGVGSDSLLGVSPRI